MASLNDSSRFTEPRQQGPPSTTTTSTSPSSFRRLLPPTYKRLIASWLEEDCPTFDNGGYVVGDQPSTAYLWCKSPGVLAGVPFFDEVFRQVGCEVVWRVNEGEWLDTSESFPSGAKGEETGGGTRTKTETAKSNTKVHIATVKGPTCALLLGERLSLNILARCSGVATASARLLALVRSHSYRGILAGTRKTTPGFRLVEKYGMLVGGCDTHRLDLSGMVMLKDNHVLACRHQEEQERGETNGTTDGAIRNTKRNEATQEQDVLGGIKAAVRKARRSAGFSTKIEVEVSTEAEAREAIEAGADVVMLDNFPLLPVSPSLPSSVAQPGDNSNGVLATSKVDTTESAPEPEAADQSVGAVARRLKKSYQGQHKFLIEVSGGITEDNVAGYLAGCAGGSAGTGGDGQDSSNEGGIDIVSTSAIHQGVKHVDFSLKIV